MSTKSYRFLGSAVLVVCVFLSSVGHAEPAEVSEKMPIDGKEIFLREWIPGDSRSHGGDGLGPMFNDSSCVACHNQGATGGGGAAATEAGSRMSRA